MQLEHIGPAVGARSHNAFLDAFLDIVPRRRLSIGCEVAGGSVEEPTGHPATQHPASPRNERRVSRIGLYSQFAYRAS